MYYELFWKYFIIILNYGKNIFTKFFKNAIFNFVSSQISKFSEVFLPKYFPTMFWNFVKFFWKLFCGEFFTWSKKKVFCELISQNIFNILEKAFLIVIADIFSVCVQRSYYFMKLIFYCCWYFRICDYWLDVEKITLYPKTSFLLRRDQNLSAFLSNKLVIKLKQNITDPRVCAPRIS